MTLRELIKNGVDLDDEIFVEAVLYDSNGNWSASYFSYDGIDSNEVMYNSDNFILKVRMTNAND